MLAPLLYVDIKLALAKQLTLFLYYHHLKLKWP